MIFLNNCKYFRRNEKLFAAKAKELDANNPPVFAKLMKVLGTENEVRSGGGGGAVGVSPGIFIIIPSIMIFPAVLMIVSYYPNITFPLTFLL